jgi:hypothetical protein
MTDLEAYNEPVKKGFIPALKRANAVNNGNKKRWGRRVGTAIVWAVLNFGLAILEPIIHCTPETIQLFMTKSTWIAGLLIVGLSSTDTVIEYVKGKNGVM